MRSGTTMNQKRETFFYNQSINNTIISINQNFLKRPSIQYNGKSFSYVKKNHDIKMCNTNLIHISKINQYKKLLKN